MWNVGFAVGDIDRNLKDTCSTQCASLSLLLLSRYFRIHHFLFFLSRGADDTVELTINK